MRLFPYSLLPITKREESPNVHRAVDHRSQVVFQDLNGYVSIYWRKDHKHIEVEARMTGESLYPSYRIISGYTDILRENGVDSSVASGGDSEQNIERMGVGTTGCRYTCRQIAPRTYRGVVVTPIDRQS